MDGTPCILNLNNLFLKLVQIATGRYFLKGVPLSRFPIGNPSLMGAKAHWFRGRAIHPERFSGGSFVCRKDLCDC
jgi:hypothetical protein